MISVTKNPTLHQGAKERASTAGPLQRSPANNNIRVVVWLSTLIAVLALIAASFGLIWQGAGESFSYTTVRGEDVELYGRGLYQYDSIFKGAGNRGTDALTIIVGIPLLIVSTMLVRRGSLRGSLLLTGTLGYFLYVYATLSVGAAYNDLFLLYVTLFSASLFAFVLAFRAIDPRLLRSRLSTHVPRRGPATLMFVSSVITLLVWLQSPIGGLLNNEAPDLLDGSTTLVTHALDIAIIVPAAFVAGLLILRSEPMGYLIAFSLLVLEVMLAPMIVAQTVFQLAAGVTFTTAEMVGPIAGFAVLAIVASWVLITLLRNVSDEPGAYLGTTSIAETQETDHN